jgi:hypothetical protein
MAKNITTLVQAAWIFASFSQQSVASSKARTAESFLTLSCESDHLSVVCNPKFHDIQTAIVVFRRFGNGKSTFLNALEGFIGHTSTTPFNQRSASREPMSNFSRKVGLSKGAQWR